MEGQEREGSTRAAVDKPPLLSITYSEPGPNSTEPHFPDDPGSAVGTPGTDLNTNPFQITFSEPLKSPGLHYTHPCSSQNR
jgi:hypothetical protein